MASPTINTLSGTLKAAVNFTGSNPALGAAYNADKQTVSFTKSVGPYTTSNANNASLGANEIVSYIVPIAAGAGVDVDLQSLTDILTQSAVSFARLKGYVLQLLSTSDDSTNGTACSGVILNAPIPAPTQNAPTVSGSGGTLAAGTYYYIVTSTTVAGESVLQVTGANNQVSATTTGTTSEVALSWNQVTDATGYKIYRSTTSGSYGASSLLTTIALGSTVTFTDTGAATTTGTPPAVNGATVANLNTLNGLSGTTINNGEVLLWASPSAAGLTVGSSAHLLHFQNLDTAKAGALQLTFVGATS